MSVKIYRIRLQQLALKLELYENHLETYQLPMEIYSELEDIKTDIQADMNL